MSKELEQPSDPIAEVSNLANPSLEKPLPSHLKDMFDLVKIPDAEPEDNIDVRCFYLADTRVMFGIVLFETADSFLVTASSRLIMDETRNIVCEPMVPVPVVRVMKHTVSMVTKPLDKYKYHFYLYLKSKGSTLIPDFMTAKVVEHLSYFIQSYKEEERPSVAKTVSEEFIPLKTEYERRGVQGVSDKAFAPHTVSEKIH